MLLTGRMTEEGKPKAAKVSSLTPKAIIHQKYGDKASYKVEEVKVLPESGCPGLAIPQKAVPCLYRCTLHLPETSFVSDTFKRKKDAEQSAADKAVEKVLICSFMLLFLGYMLNESVIIKNHGSNKIIFSPISSKLVWWAYSLLNLILSMRSWLFIQTDPGSCILINCLLIP